MSRSGSARTLVNQICSDVGKPIFSARVLTESGMRPRKLLRRRALFQTPWILRSTPARNARDRKSTRLNSSHPSISYAVFCLKKKKDKTNRNQTVRNEFML